MREVTVTRAGLPRPLGQASRTLRRSGALCQAAPGPKACLPNAVAHQSHFGLAAEGEAPLPEGEAWRAPFVLRRGTQRVLGHRRPRHLEGGVNDEAQGPINTRSASDPQALRFWATKGMEMLLSLWPKDLRQNRKVGRGRKPFKLISTFASMS